MTLIFYLKYACSHVSVVVVLLKGIEAHLLFVFVAQVFIQLVLLHCLVFHSSVVLVEVRSLVALLVKIEFVQLTQFMKIVFLNHRHHLFYERQCML
jgi:hypothetical protein